MIGKPIITSFSCNWHERFVIAVSIYNVMIIITVLPGTNIQPPAVCYL